MSKSLTKDKLFPVINCFHVVAYFQSPPGALCSLIQAACEQVAAIVGERKATIATVAMDQMRKIVKTKDSFQLGGKIPQRDKIDPNQSTVVVYSPAKRARRYKEYGIYEPLWRLDYDEYDVSQGIRTGPSFRLTIDLDWLGKEQQDALPGMARTLAESFLRCDEFRYGICDIADVQETFLGMLYSGTESNYINFQRELNRTVWLMEGDQRLAKARGVYWGNIFTASMVEQLGGPEWLDEYSSFENFPGHQLCFPLANGGYFVQICADIAEMRSRSLKYFFWTGQRAAMLYKRLCAKGLMCGHT